MIECFCGSKVTRPHQACSEREVVRLAGQNERMKAALREIAEHDYRGPRPSESVIAQWALDALGSDDSKGGFDG